MAHYTKIARAADLEKRGFGEVIWKLAVALDELTESMPKFPRNGRIETFVRLSKEHLLWDPQLDSPVLITVVYDDATDRGKYHIRDFVVYHKDGNTRVSHGSLLLDGNTDTAVKAVVNDILSHEVMSKLVS